MEATDVARRLSFLLCLALASYAGGVVDAAAHVGPLDPSGCHAGPLPLHCHQPRSITTAPTVLIEPTPITPGRPTYTGGASNLAGNAGWRVLTTGEVHLLGGAPHLGQISFPLRAPVVHLARTASANGYWLAAADGGVFAFGDAPFLGSASSMSLQRPVVNMLSDPRGRGYRLVAADGGVFAYGAPFLGSAAGTRLQAPVVGGVHTVSGDGYWLVAADGGVFAFGDAAFSGSLAGRRLQHPIVGMAADPDGQGYWLVAADGGVFTFDAPFHGSAAGMIRPPDRALDLTVHPGGGYFIGTAGGGLLAFGSASTLATPLPG
jgi:hypothetical protein